MRIAIGADHAGYELKMVVRQSLESWGHEVLDLGTDAPHPSVDYPDYGAGVGRAVVGGRAELGVAFCGTGIGVSIAANKVRGVRAAVVHDVTSAHLAREHNHANVICLGGRTTGPVVAVESVAAWLNATPEARHQPRLDKIAALEAEFERERP
jgi:ribose 5-phosphate isomerase B